MRNNRRRLGMDLRRDWQLYIFLALPVIYILVFAYIPMGGLVMAFQNYSIRRGFLGSDWVGFDNFIKFFNSFQFQRVITNTLILSLYAIIAGFPIPIIFALMINSLRSKKFRKVSQTIVNLPYFISVVVIVGLLFQIFSSRTGLYGTIGLWLTDSYPRDLFASAGNFRHFYVWSDIWQGFGWGSIIYVAALSTVDPSYHEAAEIDGATRFQRVRHIDFPCIVPTIIILLILRMGSVMGIGFEKVFLMQNNLNLSASEVISTYVYRVGLSSAGSIDFSYATAIGFFNSVVNLIMIFSANFISRRFSSTSLW